MKYPISAIEVIFNMFRLKPTEELFPKAKANDVGILVRVPLASGLLTGHYRRTPSLVRMITAAIIAMVKHLIRVKLSLV